jgi:hypothetical protein
MSDYNGETAFETVDQPVSYDDGTQNGNHDHADPKANIEKVRDILFGSQTKSNEARFARLENSLAREVVELKDLLRRRVGSLETFFQSETMALSDRIREEREERMAAFEAHDFEMKGAIAGLSRRLGELNTAVGEGDSSVRRDLMNESRKLLDEISLRHESVRGLMDSQVSELHSRKADRAVISDLMRELATQLEKDDVHSAE